MIFRCFVSALLLARCVATANAGLDPYNGIPPEKKRILLQTCVAPPPAKGSGLFAMDTSQCWDRGKILKVRFLDGTENEKEFVLKTASEWSRYANIMLERTDGSSDIRVTFSQPGFQSRIGRDAELSADDEATMILGFTDDQSAPSRRGIVLHEFGHALGFSHEHQSPAAHIHWNEKKVIAFLSGPPYHWSVEDIQRNVLVAVRPADAKKGAWTDFDRFSVMVYPIADDLTMDHVGIPFNSELSELDKKKAAELYPGKPGRDN